MPVWRKDSSAAGAPPQPVCEMTRTLGTSTARPVTLSTRARSGLRGSATPRYGTSMTPTGNVPSSTTHFSEAQMPACRKGFNTASRTPPLTRERRRAIGVAGLLSTVDAGGAFESTCCSCLQTLDNIHGVCQFMVSRRTLEAIAGKARWRSSPQYGSSAPVRRPRPAGDSGAPSSPVGSPAAGSAARAKRTTYSPRRPPRPAKKKLAAVS